MGADRAARRLGARTLHYVPRTPDDVGEQIALIDQALAQSPDAVVFVPVHPTAINPSIRRIYAAGIPVVGFINRFSEPGCVCFVGSEDYPLGLAIAGYLFERLEGRGNIVIVEGPADSVTSLARVRGYRDAAAHWPRINIVASCCGDYLREPARRSFADVLATTSVIDGVLAANDIMAAGVIEALAEAGRGAAIAGVNAVPEAIAAIREGGMIATVNFDAMQMGYLATEAAVRHLRGEAVPAGIILPVRIVDRSNCAEWDMPFETRALIEWDDAAQFFVPETAK